MLNEEVKKCIVLYNPISTGYKESKLVRINQTLKINNIPYENYPSMYAGHLIELIKQYDDNNTLLLTLGGDGTVGEAYKEFNEIEQKGLYSHIPTGTTNDMAKNYDVKSSKIEDIVLDILHGKKEEFDIYKINDYICAYTAVFGYLAHIPYVTPSYLKKHMHHLGYLLKGASQAFVKPTKYNILYKTDDKEKECSCILGAITNSKGFGGIKLFPNALLNDGKIELLLIKDINRKVITSIANDFLKNTFNKIDYIDLSKYKDHIIMSSSSKIKLTFLDKFPKMAFDVDGEDSKVVPNKDNNEINFEVCKKVKVLKNK